MRLVKRSSGRIGAAARDSMKTNSTAIARARPKAVSTCGLPQAYCPPAQVKASSKGTRQAVRVAAPR